MCCSVRDEYWKRNSYNPQFGEVLHEELIVSCPLPVYLVRVRLHAVIKLWMWEIKGSTHTEKPKQMSNQNT